jgi:hypothetical protein
VHCTIPAVLWLLEERRETFLTDVFIAQCHKRPAAGDSYMVVACENSVQMFHLFRSFALICEGYIRQQQIHASEKYRVETVKLAEMEKSGETGL